MNLELSHYQKKDVSFGNIPSHYPALQVNKGAEEIVWQCNTDSATKKTKLKKMTKTE